MSIVTGYFMRLFNSRFFILLPAAIAVILLATVWFAEIRSSADSIKDNFLTAAAPAGESAKETVITLERGICFGSCPVYKLTVSSGGAVIFEGRKYVKTPGIVKSRISPEKVRQLIAEFNKANYFSLKNKYQTREDGCPEVWTDNPTAITSIKINGKYKSIVHYYGCQENKGNDTYPKGLTTLESKIDEIVGTKQWIE